MMNLPSDARRHNRGSCSRRLAKGAVAFLAFTLWSIAGHAAGLIVTNTSGTVTTSGLSAISGFSGSQTGTFGTLATTVNGTVTYTYLGSEAGFANGAGTSFTAYASLVNQNAIYFGGTPSAVGSSFSTSVGTGTLNFGFSTLYPLNYMGTTLNGQTYTPSSISSFAIFSGGVINGVKYDYFLGYNDPYAGTPDYNDMVTGITFVAAVPEPRDYALFICGLLCVGFAVHISRKPLARRAKVTALSASVRP